MVEPPASVFADIPLQPTLSDALRVDLDRLSAENVASWRVGQTLLLNGTVLTARDAAHKRLLALLDSGVPLPPTQGLSWIHVIE